MAGITKFVKNCFQIRRLFDKIDVKASGSINWDDICAFIMQSESLKDEGNPPNDEKKFKCRVQSLVHKNRITRIETMQNCNDFVIGDSVNAKNFQNVPQFRLDSFQPGRAI